MGRDQREPAKIREQYEREKEMAEKLLNSTPEERHTIYTSLYNELFSSIKDHPQLTRKISPEQTSRKVAYEIRHFKKFITKETVFMEIGAGDSALSLEVAKLVKKVYAIDVSQEITENAFYPENFELIISDGTSIPVPEGSVHLAYSQQLMEHLHPDDSIVQLRNIYRALAPGGIYLCLTPNRLNGPHDISKYFDRVATALHLKEYTVMELNKIFKETGFLRTKILVPIKNIRIFIPVIPVLLLEKIMGSLPYSLRKSVASKWLIAKLLGIRMVGIK